MVNFTTDLFCCQKRSANFRIYKTKLLLEISYTLGYILNAVELTVSLKHDTNIKTTAFKVLEGSKSPVIRKLVTDGRILGSIKVYDQEFIRGMVLSKWNSRLKDLMFCGHFGFCAKKSGNLRKHFHKAHTRQVVQLQTQHSDVGYFQFELGRWFTPPCLWTTQEGTAVYFSNRCPFYSNIQNVFLTKRWKNCWKRATWEIWESTYMNWTIFFRGRH